MDSQVLYWFLIYDSWCPCTCICIFCIILCGMHRWFNYPTQNAAVFNNAMHLPWIYMMKHSSSKPFIFKCWTFHNYWTDLDCLPAKYIWASILRSGYNFDIFRPEDQHVCFWLRFMFVNAAFMRFRWAWTDGRRGADWFESHLIDYDTWLIGEWLCGFDFWDTPLSYLQNASWKSSWNFF